MSSLTPNAASLGLFGEIPVSLYTGTPDISIPLYDLKVKDFTLPISLSYHASGVRVDQRPSWVGVGWNLFAGGAITRSICDVPDDYNNPTYIYDVRGYYFTYNVLNTSNWNQRSYLRSVAQDVNKYLSDTAPDKFSFNFNGYSGSFYLDHNRNWVVKCNKPVKVIFDNTFIGTPFDGKMLTMMGYGNFPCFKGFTIITENGTRYVFGGSNNAIDFATSFFGQADFEWVATAWYLTKIILPTGQQIDFQYERREFTNQMGISVSHDIVTKVETSGGLLATECSSSSTSSSIWYHYGGRLLSPVYLTEISSDNSVISFSSNVSNELKYDQATYDYQYSLCQTPTDRGAFLPFLKSDEDGYPHYPACLSRLKSYKLQSITIKDKFQQIPKMFFLTYNNGPDERLTLYRIHESGKSPYTFLYYNMNQLPGYLANKSDHWGFYNNTDAPITNYSNYYGYRNPDSLYTKYGILNKIIYPTGGYTEFEYEAHQYRKQLNTTRDVCNTLSSNQIAGGVRIKRIKNSDTSEGPAKTVKEFFYASDYLQNGVNASQSSGILGGQIQYYFTDYTVYAFGDRDRQRYETAFSSTSVLNSCQNTEGSHIGYTEVIEKHPDDSFIRYQFTNFDNGYMDEPADAIIQASRTPYEPYNSKASDRGLLLLQEDYNSSGKKVKSKNIIYENDGSGYVRSMTAVSFDLCAPGIVADEGSAYKIYTYLLRPSTETETYYDPASGSAMQSLQTSYLYTNKKLIRSVSITNSNTAIHKTEYKYPFDFSGNTTLTKMVNLNALSPLVEKIQQVNSTKIRTDFIDYTMMNDSCYYPTTFSVQHGSGEKTTEVTYSKYDSYGNPVFIEKRNGEQSVYLWSYNNQYPIAEIKNATYDQVKNILGENLINQIASSNKPSDDNFIAINNLRTDTCLLNAQVTTYTYKPLVGIQTITDLRDVKTTYEYDSFNRLKYIRDENGNAIENYDYHYQNE
ncbi:hypothetical protein FACS189437_01520 [Bacteroidia bacterium]|nr:hypothetical protein FACS189437_01520 [Bacteroidia bacterium]